MKKIVVLFAVFALAAPLSADDLKLSFKTVKAGADTWVEVHYDASAAGQLPRGFAFDMELDNGAIFQAIDSYKTNVFSENGDKGYGVYLDTIDFGADPNTIDDSGSPVSVAPDALPGIGSNGLTICMASLYDPCDISGFNAPDPTGLLFRVRVSKAVTALTCTEDDDTRGGVVFEDGAEGGLDAPGYMVVWGYAGFCNGDGTGDDWVNTADFFLIRDSFLKNYTNDWNAGAGPYNPAADFTMDGFVNTADFFKLRDSFLVAPIHNCTVKPWPPVI